MGEAFASASHIDAQLWFLSGLSRMGVIPVGAGAMVRW